MQGEKLFNAKESETDFSRQTMGGYKSITYACGLEIPFTIKHFGDTGICDPIKGFEQTTIKLEEKPDISSLTCEN